VVGGKKNSQGSQVQKGREVKPPTANVNFFNLYTWMMANCKNASEGFLDF
jgi:hypothetical protein